MIELYVSENKSFDPVRFYRNRVRVFLNRDYTYGLWIDEDRLFDLLTEGQMRQYILDRSPKGAYFSVTREVAQEILKRGHTPYAKQNL